MWVRKVKLHSSGGLYFLIPVELRAIVCRDRLEDRSMLSDQTDYPLVQLCCRPVGQLSDQGVTGLALHQGHNAVLVAFAHDRVDFPMTLGAAEKDAQRRIQGGDLGDDEKKSRTVPEELDLALSFTFQRFDRGRR